MNSNIKKGLDYSNYFAAICVPLDDDYNINEVELRNYVRWLSQIKHIDGLVCNGHTGEITSLSPEERAQVTAIVADETKQRCTIVSGVCAEGTLEAIKHAKAAKEAGADAILLMPPHIWLRFGMNPASPYEHFRRVAEEADIDIIIHLYPYGTKAFYPIETVLQIASLPHVKALFFGAGQFLTQKNKDGLPEFCLNTDKTQYLMDFFYDLFFNGNQTLFYVDNDPMEKNWTSIFEAGRILFVPMQVNGMERLRNMANDFGMLPFPKYDSAQEKYYSMVNGHAPMLVLPNTISDPDRTGLIIESLAAESSITVKPTYAEIVTKVKYSRDNDTSLMIDYILESRTYDFGYLYTGASGMGFILTNLMDNKSKNFTSAYEKIEGNTIKQYEKVIETYLELSSS